MKAVWRYVKQVEKHLPRERRVEVAGELYASLKRKAEAEEAAKGRKLAPDEIAALLASFGEPPAVAARFAVAPGSRNGLLERYLAAVVRRLPAGQSYDILAELREAIGARIEAREEALGRRLGDEDISAILKDFGHPVIVASRYCGQEYLVGPQLYPWFWPAQRTAVGIVTGVLAVLIGIGLLQAERPLSRFIGSLDDLAQAAFLTFGVVTAVFVLLEHSGSQLARRAIDWKPRDLPHDHVRAPKGLFESVFSLLCDVIFILWWVRWVTFPNTMGQGEEAVSLHFSAAWEPVHGVILVLACLSAAVHLADIAHPAWSRIRSGVTMLGYAGGVAVAWMLLSAGPLVDVSAPEGAGERLRLAQWLVDGPFRWALIVAAVIWGVSAMVEAGRQMRAIRLLAMAA